MRKEMRKKEMGAAIDESRVFFFFSILDMELQRNEEEEEKEEWGFH